MNLVQVSNNAIRFAYSANIPYTAYKLEGTIANYLGHPDKPDGGEFADSDPGLIGLYDDSSIYILEPHILVQETPADQVIDLIQSNANQFGSGLCDFDGESDTLIGLHGLFIPMQAGAYSDSNVLTWNSYSWEIPENQTLTITGIQLAGVYMLQISDKRAEITDVEWTNWCGHPTYYKFGDIYLFDLVGLNRTSLIVQENFSFTVSFSGRGTVSMVLIHNISMYDSVYKEMNYATMKKKLAGSG